MYKRQTLALAALGLLRFQGALKVEGQGWGQGQASDLALRRAMQVVFQDPFSSLSPRMTVEQIVGERAGVTAQRIDLYHRHCGGCRRTARFAQHRAGTALDGGVDEATAVGALAGQGEEEVARLHLTRIGAQRARHDAAARQRVAHAGDDGGSADGAHQPSLPVALLRAICSTGTGASGGTPVARSVAFMMSENTGAAT